MHLYFSTVSIKVHDMTISIIIPNYNGERLLKENFPKIIITILDDSYKVNEIIIIDDFSDDNSVEVINELIKLYKKQVKIILVENKKNLGFSSSINSGVSKATGELLVLLNTDVAPQEEFIFKAIKHFKDDKVFAVGCLDKSEEKGSVVLRGRGIGKWHRGFLIHSRGEIDKTNTLWVSGGSGIFRKSIWEKLHGFTELYNPFYWEDIDLSYRALKSGYKLIFAPESIVVHMHEEGAIKTRYSEFLIRVISYRNQILFIWLNITDQQLIFSHILWTPYYFLITLIKGNIAFYLGYFLAITKALSLLNLRKANKKTFIKSDEEVLGMIA